MKILDIKKIDFPQFDTKESSLFVYESGKLVPFTIQRVFTIKTIEACTRGFHAHKHCTQVLTVLHGECNVTCDDGTMRQSFRLNHASQGLLIPPTIWAEQAYLPNTILMVLTDHPYDEADYIRDYDAFLNFRGKFKR